MKKAPGTPDSAAGGSIGVSLWRTTDGIRAFLIPDGTVLLPGELTIKQARLVRSVDPEAIADFEVSTEQAERCLREQLGRVLRTLGGNLRRSFTSGAAVDAVASSPIKDRLADVQVTPGLDLLAAITGTPRADLDAGGGAVVEALKRYASDLGGTVAGAVSGDAGRIASAKERMAEWSATLRAHGTEVADGGPAKPVRSASPPPAGPKGSEPDPTEPESATAAGSRSSATQADSGFAARLNALADDFRRRADALAAAREDGAPTPTGEATDAQRPAAPNPTAAAALEALAQGLEDSATDAAARLRRTAARLRQSRNDDADGTPPRADGDSA